jgi:hypothetical protein
MNYADPTIPSPLDENPNIRYRFGAEWHKMFGGKLLENICQFLARIIVMDAGVRVWERTGCRFALQAHDELVWVVPDVELANMKLTVMEEMTRTPSWATANNRILPLIAEVQCGSSYGSMS